MNSISVVLIGLMAGFHAALYGAYKDSPHESFLTRRFVRELVFAVSLAAVLAALHLSDGQTPFILYLTVFALARIATEFWKLFLRIEPQEDYRIPTQVHWVKGVVHNPLVRLIMGIGFLAGIYGCYRLFLLLPESLPRFVTGLIIGGGIGLGEAIVGAYKDGSIEGFSFRKFLKSPTFGALGGLIACLHTDNPAFLMLAVGLLYPALRTIYQSFFDRRTVNFVGLDNYERLLTRDSRFLNRDEFPWSGALINNIRWLIVYPILCLTLGLITAVLATRVRYEGAFKAIIFVPMAISATAVGVIWLLVFSPDPDIGVVNALVAGAGGEPVSWLGRADLANYAIILAYVWASTGFVMVVLSAALKGISQEVIEAARTDGATEWDIFRRIQFPLLSLPIAVVSVWMIINVIKVFDIVYIMTKGGPGGATRVIAYSYYVETFENGLGGYGASVAVVMLLLIIPVMIWQIRRFRSEAVVS